MDNGKEFYQHIKIAKALKVENYFCRPYHSWEKGLNENTNGLIRQYFPKQTNFRNISDREIRRVQDELNHQPKKHLATKRQVFYSRICSNHWYPSVALEIRIQEHLHLHPRGTRRLLLIACQTSLIDIATNAVWKPSQAFRRPHHILLPN